MTPTLLDHLRLPGTDSPLTYEPAGTEGVGWLVGPGGERFPVEDGIPRFVESEAFVDTFGFQWNRFDVRHQQEDEETFELKTGVRLADLAGLTVLDAGCGGGRYSRVAAEAGADVVGVDRSVAVIKAAELTAHLADTGRVAFVQADLTELPFRAESFDLVFSIGVLHHGPDTWQSLAAIAKMVRPGGRLSVWLYRRNTWPQEVLNDALRWTARRMPRRMLLAGCQVLAVLGGVPVVNRTSNKLVNFSNHPSWQNRVCDNYDWYAPRYQHHHTVAEATRWFEELGFREVRELPPAKQGAIYDRAFRAGLIIGSGVNVTGIRG